MKKIILWAIITMPVVALVAVGCNNSNRQSGFNRNSNLSSNDRLNEANVSALGTLEPISEVHFLAGPVRQFGGMPRINTIFVKVGQRVAKNQILVEFENVAESDAERERIAANIQRKKQEIMILENQTKRFKDLTMTGAYPVSDLEEKKARLASYYSQLQEFVGTLKTLNQRQRNDTVIRSPITGTVLRIDSHPGEQSRPEGVLQVGDTSQMQAILEVDENDISRIRVGQHVTVRSENNSFKGSLEGNVKLIGLRVMPKRRLTADPSLDTAVENRTFEVRVLLNNESSRRSRNLTGVKIRGIIKQ